MSDIIRQISFIRDNIAIEKSLHILSKFIFKNGISMAFSVVYFLLWLVLFSMPFLYCKGRQRWLSFTVLLILALVLSGMVGKVLMGKAYIWYYKSYLA